MARPTREQLRRLLQDWGLPQVDPDSYFVGVFPESISIAVDEVERLTAQDRGWTESRITANIITQNTTKITATIMPIPGPNEIVVFRSLALDLISANIESVQIVNQGTSGNGILWQEGVSGGPALPAGRFIGGPDIRTTSFNSVLPIVLDGRDAQLLKLILEIAVAAVMDAKIVMSAQIFQRPFVGFAT